MKLRLLAALLLMGLAAMPLAAQTLVVGYQQRAELRIPGATAAYSLNSFYADATLVDGVVVVQGNSPGMTTIIVVTGVGLLNFRVSVPQPANVYPPGFEPPRAGRNYEEGNYELRYSSDPAQLLNTFDFSSRQGDRLIRFHMINSNYVTGATSGSPVGLPALSWEMDTPRRDVTLVDQVVANSPLTLDNVLVRGFHLREGNWFFHGGYTAQSLFQNLLLPTEKDTAVGLGYRIRLGTNNSLTPNFYYLDNASSSTLSGRSGSITSLVFRREIPNRLKFLAETGWGGGAGGAMRLDYQRDLAEHIYGNFRYEPRNFSSVAVNDLHGLLSEFRWDRKLGRKASSALNFAGNRYDMSQSQQVNISMDWLLEYRLNKAWSVNSGLSYARFTGFTTSGALQNMQVPAGVNFTSAHFSAGALYRAPAMSSQGSSAGGVRGNVSVGVKQWHLTMYVDRETDVPTVASLVSSVPGLQDLLDRLGISAISPQQISDLLHNESILQALGLVNQVTLNLSPVLLQAGATLNWMSKDRSHQQLFLSFLYNSNEMSTTTQQSEIIAGTYSRLLSRTNTAFISYSMFRSQNSGSSPRWRPLLEFSIRHRFSSAPRLLTPGRKGTISGMVFEDVQLEGVYREGMPPLAGEEIILDGSRRTVTDAAGRYWFTGVPYGPHNITAKVRSDRPFYFSTQSEATAEIDTVVNFGVVFSRARLIGLIENDAEAPIAGVGVTVSVGEKGYSAMSDADGKFNIANLAEGKCTVAIRAESLPSGYRPDELETQPCELRAGLPTHVSFKLKAIRSIGGLVRIFDSAANTEVPVAGVKVRILETGAESVTDKEGNYLFRQMSAGVFTLVASYEGRDFKLQVTLPPAPTYSRNNNFDLGKR
jgi:hypothetical protein